MEELELIRKAQTGDLRAFEDLMRRHDKRVLQIAYSMLGNLHDAQDVYQETFMRVHLKLTTYRFEASFAAWLGRIVVNLALNARKKRSRRRWFTLEALTQPGKESALSLRFSEPAKAMDGVLSGELHQQVNTALDTLPATERTAFALKHLHGYKITEIAQMMACAEGSVKNYIFRATRKLRRKLKPYHAGSGSL